MVFAELLQPEAGEDEYGAYAYGNGSAYVSDAIADEYGIAHIET